MVKTLVNICLSKIENSLCSHLQLGKNLNRKCREILIERLCWHNRFTSRDLAKLATSLFTPNLMRINICYSDRVDDMFLELLTNSRCYPEYITISRCPKITSKGIAKVAKITKRTEEIILRKLPGIDDNCLFEIGSPFLARISLCGCVKITDLGIMSIIKNNRNLKSVDISWLHLLTDRSVIEIAKTLGPKLEELDAAGLNQLTSLSTLALASYCPNLRRANFEDCVKLNGVGLTEMASCCKVEELNISICKEIEDTAMQEILSQSLLRNSLQCLHINGLPLEQESLDMAATLQHLTTLSLCGIASLNDSNFDRICMTAGFRVKELQVSNCTDLTDKACQSITTYCTAVSHLSLMNLFNITGVTILPLLKDKSRALKLKELLLSGSKNFQIDVVRVAISECQNLEVLCLAALKGLDDDVAFSIARNLPNIRILNIKNGNFSDCGICEIAAYCNELQLLNVAGNHKLTDRSVFSLAENCTKLEEFYLSGCAKVTKAALQYLSDNCTNPLYYEHKVPNAPNGLLMAKNLDSGSYVRVDQWFNKR